MWRVGFCLNGDTAGRVSIRSGVWGGRLRTVGGDAFLFHASLVTPP